MADKQISKTTSSKSLDGNTNEQKTQQRHIIAASTPSLHSMPKSSDSQMLTKLAGMLNENFQMVKQRQQHYNDLTANAHTPTPSPCQDEDEEAEWLEVYSAKNKLKRKKTLSASLTSVTDLVNQEKRTRIEGIHLNCRGRLQLPAAVANSTPTVRACEKSATAMAAKPPLPHTSTMAAVTTKAAVPQKQQSNTTNVSKIAVVAAASPVATTQQVTTAPPRLKRKLEENVLTIQKLNALTEQLRLEINELKSNLTTERGAVRVLRAQNESESRKWKNEVKKLQGAVDTLKKSGKRPTTTAGDGMSASSLSSTEQQMSGSAHSLANYEIQRLTNEIITLKEANKALEEKKMINCDADRRKAADMRTLKDSYEIRLTQLTKSAKTEISRLLEEIKTKERNIGQLKKDLHTLQTTTKPPLSSLPHHSSAADVAGVTAATAGNGNGGAGGGAKSRNATTNKTNPNNNNKTTNKNTTTKKNNNKNINNNSKNATRTAATSTKSTEIDESKTTIKKDVDLDNKPTTTTNSDNDLSQAQNPDEMTKLKDIELINNTKNLQNLKTNTKILNTQNNQNNCIPNTNTNTNTTHNSKQQQQQQSLDRNDHQPQQHHLKLKLNTELNILHTSNNNHNNNNNNNVNNKTTTCNFLSKEYHSMPHESMEPWDDEEYDACTKHEHINNNNNSNSNNNNASNTNKHNNTNNNNSNNAHEYRAKDHHNSDSDSAVSSAPPSISPQPPPAGLDTADIWQMIRTYSTDITKLQKDIDMLQKENEQLHRELNAAKEQILESEKITLETNKSTQLAQLMERIKCMEEQEIELREQNELLEFRILELEDTTAVTTTATRTDNVQQKRSWSPQSHNTAATANDSNTSPPRDVWGMVQSHKEDPMEMLFGSTRSVHIDSGITSPHHSQPAYESDLENARDDVSAHDELRHRVACMLKKSTLDADDRQCLEQVLVLVQQLDAMSQRSNSGPNSLNTNSSSSSSSTSNSNSTSGASGSGNGSDDTNSSIDLVKSRVSDYSSASSASGISGRSNSYESCATSFRFAKCIPSSGASPSHGANGGSSGPRIIATVPPYNSTQTTAVIAPTNTPTDSPRKQRQSWQCNSLSESGVFVESDFLSDASENLNACTQTDFDRQPLTPQRLASGATKGIGLAYAQSPSVSDQKRLQYYKDRLELLENKVLIYESSGDLQAKRLADRLQREIQLEKELRELKDRVNFLESENLTLEEEKCEFEEAENDTRLRLQRLEVELEILSQRNIELEMSREALSAKYKDCRSECLILRDDLSVSETQIRHLEEDKQKAKENLEFLHSTLPLFLICNTLATLGGTVLTVPQKEMGNVLPETGGQCPLPDANSGGGRVYESNMNYCQERELHCLREEVKRLHHQIKELNSRHYEALESADSHWVDLEREYKDREEAFRAKEHCLKQKIQKLQDCLRDDARAANEKILQLEEAEKELKCCLIRVSKEHREIIDEHANVIAEYERFKEQYEQLQAEQKPLADAFEAEKKRCKCLSDELHFMQRLQQETESRGAADLEALRTQLNDLRKEFLHIEVTNGELKEEVATLEQQLETLQRNERDHVDKIRCLSDEVRTKEEMCQKLEKQLERSEGFSLAQELGGGSPSKRFKREDITDLRSANKGLGSVLRNIKQSEVVLLPTHQQFQSVARDVKKLADSLLKADGIEEEFLQEIEDQINEELMNFHTRKMESEFYCTVYYPIKRQVSLDVLKTSNY